MWLLIDGTRQSKYFADDLTVRLGYGRGMQTYLERTYYQDKPRSSKERLLSTHPNPILRIERILNKLPRKRIEVDYFMFVTPQGVVQSSMKEYVYRFEVNDEYPKIVPCEGWYEIYIDSKNRLHHRAKTLVEAQRIESYLRGVAYNINGCWNAGG
jgi:hypothetical protein